jgi:uncharacterized membrane protein
MNNDLIAMTFTTEEGASKTRQALEMMRGSQFWGLVNTVIVTRDSSGTVFAHQQREIPADEYSPSLLLPEVLIDEILGANPEAGLRRLVGAGLSESFLKEITSALVPNSSAILIYIRHGSMVNPQQVLDALKQFAGTAYHTTVPEDVENEILRQAGD